MNGNKHVTPSVIARAHISGSAGHVLYNHVL